MEEVLIKSHLVVTDVQDQYDMRWTGRVYDTQPEFKNGKPIFIIISGYARTELNTTDMVRLEETAKILTRPKGRTAVTSDIARIYIKEIDGKETLLGTLTHKRVKSYAPVYDKVGWRD